jgi:acyl transferase domain-containing protein
VSSFGFGGTNWHITLEGFDRDYHEGLVARLAMSGAIGSPAVLLHSAMTARQSYFHHPRLDHSARIADFAFGAVLGTTAAPD